MHLLLRFFFTRLAFSDPRGEHGLILTWVRGQKGPVCMAGVDIFNPRIPGML